MWPRFLVDLLTHSHPIHPISFCVCVAVTHSAIHHPPVHLFIIPSIHSLIMPSIHGSSYQYCIYLSIPPIVSMTNVNKTFIYFMMTFHRLAGQIILIVDRCPLFLRCYSSVCHCVQDWLWEKGLEWL